MYLQTYRKRWFVISGGRRDSDTLGADSGYTLTIYKDEKSTHIKGKILLETCTQAKKVCAVFFFYFLCCGVNNSKANEVMLAVIHYKTHARVCLFPQNSRYKALGFELVTMDDKVFYPLAADSETELDEWVETLNKVIAISQGGEAVDQVSADISSFYAKETMKDPKKIDISSDLLEVSWCVCCTCTYNYGVGLQNTSGTDPKNAHNRQKDSHPLFHVYPELMVCLSVQVL